LKALSTSSDILQETGSADIIAGRPIPESPFDVCYTIGWLQAEVAEDDESKLYFFSSPLHRR